MKTQYHFLRNEPKLNKCNGKQLGSEKRWYKGSITQRHRRKSKVKNQLLRNEAKLNKCIGKGMMSEKQL